MIFLLIVGQLGINDNTSLDALENILVTTTKRCLKIKMIKKRHTKLSSTNKWFEKEFRLKKHELRKLSNPKHRDPLNMTRKRNE